MSDTAILIRSWSWSGHKLSYDKKKYLCPSERYKLYFAITAVGTEIMQIREAALENRAAIDYLLQHTHGCEEFKGMCCFNLTNNSQLIEGKIQQSKELASEIKEQERLDVSWLFLWLPNLNWLKQLFLFTLFIIVLIIITCYILQCLPFCRPTTQKGVVLDL